MTSLSYLNDKDNFDATTDPAATESSQVERIVRAIAGGIAEGKLIADQRLPSIRAMAAEHRVSRDTVQRGYDKLVAGGHLYARRGAGFYVAAAPMPPVRDTTPRPMVDLEPFQLIHTSLPPDRCPGSGVLLHDDGSVDELHRIVKGVVASGQRLGGYGDPAGYLPLRQQLQNKLRIEGIDAPLPSILTVPGCVAGLTLVVRSFIRPRSLVLVEDPASFIHTTVLLAQGAEIMRVPREADGPDLDVLRLLCERYRPAMFLMTSVLHNPTGSSLSLPKARKLIEIAAEFDMMVVDDASYADLSPPAGARPVVPLAVLDQLDHVIHVGGSSHILAPDVGTGYVVAHERRMELLRLFRPAQGLGNMLIQERVLYRLLSDGLYRRRCERIRAMLAQRATIVRHALAEAGCTVAPAGGGLFLWADLGQDRSGVDVARRMLKHGFLTAPGSHFSPPKTDNSHMRFNATTTTAAALAALADCL
ncbi:PLP-dependent aminotransferase family protein [uncultured Sphingomonas sp.]|uniref:aminotransferase-like domain-containing protein n=1 Tax=uncultured Sphingomonas sp. TaxID=158754 RepID=UPI0025859A0F|nr:PLP-dependent aminotransferase family protein [uncultured Sphingomonas sp.]